MTDTFTSTSAAIAALNDAFRRAGPCEDWLFTAGVREHGPAFVAASVEAVMSYVDFNPDNDPHREHDLGVFKVAGVKVWFKIDYYDETLSWGSPDPTDPSVTRRVLTILLPSED